MVTQYKVLQSWLTAQCKTDRGATMVEYALVVALIAVAAIVGVSALGGEVNDEFSDIGDELSNNNATTVAP